MKQPTHYHATRQWDKLQKSDCEAYNHQCDSQEMIDLCLNCPIPDRCRPGTRECPLNGGARAMIEAKERERYDDAVLRAFKAGWSVRRMRDTFRTSDKKVLEAKERLIKQGRLPKGGSK